MAAPPGTMSSPGRASSPPRALTIAGSDSGGGAGVQADLKTFFALGCHGMSAFAALTAQNTTGVAGIHRVPPEFVIAQIEAVVTDIGVDAAKTGMLASAPIVEAVARAVTDYRIERIVVDPVFMAKSRDRLLTEDAIGALVTELIPLSWVVTPNIPEAEALVPASIASVADMADAARALHARGARAVLVKGGHLEDDRAVDVFFDGSELVELDQPRVRTKDTHGTGCVLAAATAARLAHGDPPLAAVRFAKGFVTGAIERALRLGRGYGPVNPGWDLPLG